MKPIHAEVEGPIEAELETVFDVLMPIDLRTILTGHGPLPAVVAVEEQTGDWSSIGESRIIRLADGSGMLETLTAVERPHRFAYALTAPTSALRFLVRSFRGAWSFEPIDDGRGGPRVRAVWRYEFEPRSRLGWPLAWWIVKRLWRPYMAEALARATEQAERVERAGAAARARPAG